jgi:hypothetical protein
LASKEDQVNELMPDKLHDVFFYGLFMDERVLQEKGIHPRASRRAVVHGHQLKIGQRAMLLAQSSSQAFGMVHTLNEREISSLYDAPGLQVYRPETVVATFEDGSTSTVTTFNLPETFVDEEPNVEYAAKLRSVLELFGFPDTF